MRPADDHMWKREVANLEWVMAGREKWESEQEEREAVAAERRDELELNQSPSILKAKKGK